MEETITSRRNPLLAHTKKLLTSRAYREKSGEFAADGVKLLAEAARWYPGLHTVIAEEHVELCKLSDTVRVVRVPRDVMQSVSLMDAPQGAIFLCPLPERKPGTILPGITRDSVIQLLKKWGVKVSERKLSIDEVVAASKDGSLQEIFASGTAAVISPIGWLNVMGTDVQVADGTVGPVAQKLYDTLYGMQTGTVADDMGWTYRLL